MPVIAAIAGAGRRGRAPGRGLRRLAAAKNFFSQPAHTDPPTVAVATCELEGASMDTIYILALIALYVVAYGLALAIAQLDERQ